MMWERWKEEGWTFCVPVDFMTLSHLILSLTISHHKLDMAGSLTACFTNKGSKNRSPCRRTFSESNLYRSIVLIHLHIFQVFSLNRLLNFTSYSTWITWLYLTSSMKVMCQAVQRWSCAMAERGVCHCGWSLSQLQVMTLFFHKY